MMEIGVWSAWASPLAWTIGTLSASRVIGHLLGAAIMSRVPQWLTGRQRRLTESALQIVRKRLPCEMGN